jgi:periplasmic copper chaperone A
MCLRRAILIAMTSLVVAPPAAAHVTLDPSEWEAGGFARFAIRVPNERDNAATTRITVQFPESVVEARFEPEPGWKRTIKMVALDEPIEQEGEEPITQRLASVTWSGGRIAPGEFVDFGVSFQVPETGGDELLFPSIQTYSDGDVVRWIAADPEAETPAPRVAVLAAEEEEAAGASDTETQAEAGAEAAPTAAADDDGNGRATLALVLGAAGLLAGLAALALGFARRSTERA